MMESELTSLPPVFAASALYDNLLQAALRQFFSRATFETEPIPSLSSDGRLAIEPTGDPSVLSVRWFGSRHVLHVPPRRPFTEHEVRLARAIGAVLAMRYRAIFDPKQMLDRQDLFRGAIEDRYIGAFLDKTAYSDPSQTRADLIANAIEVLRVAALSSYENRAISSGVLILDTDEDPFSRQPASEDAVRYSQTLTGIKSFYRLCDGLTTVFLVNRTGFILEIVEVARRISDGVLDVPCSTLYKPHALATEHNRDVCIVLSPSHEIKVFAEGVQVFSFRNARWHLLDVAAKYRMWAESVGNPTLAERLFQTGLDLADAREGALFVVLRDPSTALQQLVAPADQLDGNRAMAGTAAAPSRSQLLQTLRGETVTGLDPAVLAGLAKVDGATVMNRSGELLAVGAILLHTEPPEPHSTLAVEGARTTAAMAAGRFGAVLKVSEDGLITFYDQQERIWDI
jgi:hypothetical protein